MPSLTGTDLIKALFPAIDAAVDDAIIDLFVEMAVEANPVPSVWGDLYAQAIAYYAAHDITMQVIRGANGATGPVTGERAGEVSRNYGFSTLAYREDGLNETPPGRKYLALLRRIPGTKLSSTSRVFEDNR